MVQLYIFNIFLWYGAGFPVKGDRGPLGIYLQNLAQTIGSDFDDIVST